MCATSWRIVIIENVEGIQWFACVRETGAFTCLGRDVIYSLCEVAGWRVVA